MNNECIFCKIINLQIPSYIIYEDKYNIAILPKEMEVYGHTLVLPKAHYESIFDIPEEILWRTINFSKKIIENYKQTISASWVNILNASWVDAQQSVPHFHIHLLPRFKNDRIDAWPKLETFDIDKEILLTKIRIKWNIS